MSSGWYALVDHEVIGPFDPLDLWYHDHAGPDWRAMEFRRSGVDPWLVAAEKVGDKIVSTVFLGLDHQWRPDWPSLLFETMVLPDCEMSSRCTTWDEAVAMHDRMVAEVAARQSG